MNEIEGASNDAPVTISLEFALDSIEEVLNGVGTLDVITLEGHVILLVNHSDD